MSSTKELICVLHHGTKSGEISYDLNLRLSASRILAEKNPDADICFVGGGGLQPISGAQSMTDFWQTENHDLHNKSFMLDSSNNTAANIREIIMYLEKQNDALDISIISNAYHRKRIRFFIKKYALHCKVMTAEEILMENGKQQELPAYLKSVGYRFQVLREFLLRGYAFFDQNQRLAQLWRYCWR
ncbi:MAG: ElyC/SanA/YdcF family protein [Parcubacteria group bacterium]|jgi:hypothetical protein